METLVALVQSAQPASNFGSLAVLVYIATRLGKLDALAAGFHSRLSSVETYLAGLGHAITKRD